jgi:uracil-DNA glycosylase
MRDSLDKVARDAGSCQDCLLYKKTTNVVPGEGSDKAEIFFIGEAPGKTEDETGRPFCGRAGELLNSMLESIDLKREEVFIGNIIKHRPPDNRDPEEEEKKACFKYLKRQLNIIKPKIIATLGRHALNSFLPEVAISKVHGQPKRIYWHKSSYIEELEMYQEKIVIVPLYHPAAGLYRGSMKETLFKDFKVVSKTLEKIKKEK